MILIDVKSSQIKAVGYDSEKEFLVILFHTNETQPYVYAEVEEDEFASLIQSESLGSYFNRYIKGHYDFIKSTMKDVENL